MVVSVNDFETYLILINVNGINNIVFSMLSF